MLWNGNTYPVVDYCELISPTTAEVWGRYGTEFYQNIPALLHNRYKAGQAYYIGCRDTGELSDALYEKLLAHLHIKTYDLPESVSIHSREEYLFIENCNGKSFRHLPQYGN